MGTLFPTRVPANLLPVGTRVPVYWIEDVTRTHLEWHYPGVPSYPFPTLLLTNNPMQ